MKGYKIFLPDFSSKEGKMIFKEGETFEVKLPIKICNWGLHFCLKAQDCFNYYPFDPKNIVCEVEAIGETQGHEEDSKICTNKLKIGRRLEWHEVLLLANTGANNTGHSNSGYRNSGYRNSGYRNSGYSNSGYRNSGNWNSGYRNSGYRNSGYRNSGDSNSGYRNSGNWNSGDSNSGDRNSGNWNSGYRNSGDSNSGYRNSGAFCSDLNPKLWLFDKPTDILVKDWEDSEAVRTMNDLLEPNLWVCSENMTVEEKEQHSTHETTGGYLKKKTMHEAWADMWHNLSEGKRKLFLDLPHFDSAKFKEITGITV